MIPSILKAATLTLAVLLSGQIQAKDEDRLLPTSALAKLEVKYDIDGQALHVNIKNGSSLTVTSGKLLCDKYDTRLPKPSVASNGFPWCTGKISDTISGRYKNCEYDSGYLEFFKETIKPGKVTKLYFEPKDYQVPIIRCDISDLRGREAKFWE